QIVSLPPTSERDGTGGRISAIPLDKDPWVRPSQSNTVKRKPSINDVMTGSSAGGYPAVPSYNADVWSQATWITDSALTSARYAAYDEVRAMGDNKKSEAFLQRWHEASLGSINQLQNVVNEYYSLSLYNEAQLANYDIAVIDPYQSGSINQRNAIESFIAEKRWPRAERALKRGIEQYPTDDFYIDGLVRVYKATGRKNDIAELEIARLERQLETNPDDAAALERLLRQLALGR